MIRLFVGAVLAAVVLFAWGFVFWAASGVMYRFLRPLPDEAEVTQALQKGDIESGTYLIPFPAPDAMSGKDAAKAEELRRRSLRGPVVEIIYRKEGLDPTDPQQYVAGFCHFLAASLLAGVLLVMAQPGLRRYPARVLFVTLVGVFAAVAVVLSKPVWFHHPWPAALYESAYVVIGWLLAGIVLALVIRPAKEAAKSVGAAPRAADPAASTPEVFVTPPAAPPSP